MILIFTDSPFVSICAYNSFYLIYKIMQAYMIMIIVFILTDNH